MDLTLPYTLYPSVLPHWIAWGFFLIGIIGAIGVSVMIARVRKPWVGLVAFLPVLIGLLILTVVCSMVVAFFVHQ